jgi:hypothetical protein
MAYTIKTEEKKVNTTEEKTAIPEGDYLVRLERSIEKEWNNKKYLSLMFRICEGQKYGNLCLFKSIYKNEQGDYNFTFLGNMLKSIGYNEGTQFENIDDVLKLLMNKEYLAHVKVDDKDTTRNYISFFKNNSVDFTGEDEPF